MKTTEAIGSCLCGEVEYQITGNMGIFQYCHCSRCRKVTGSAHASNLFVTPEQFNWLKGQSSVVNFLPQETKYFATAFCEKCGSSLPWRSKGSEVSYCAGRHAGYQSRDRADSEYILQFKSRLV